MEFQIFLEVLGVLLIESRSMEVGMCIPRIFLIILSRKLVQMELLRRSSEQQEIVLFESRLMEVGMYIRAILLIIPLRRSLQMELRELLEQQGETQIES